VTLVAWGAMVPIALDAASAVSPEGIDVEVIDLRTLAPLDWETLVGSVDKTGRLVATHEAPRTGGPGGELVASLVERCFYALRSPPQRVAGADVVYPPQLLEDVYLPDTARIAAALRAVMDD
jgi:pyruvate dehydrogenase E1 component beta subunit